MSLRWPTDVVTLYVLYRRPSDFPDQWVIRAWDVSGDTALPRAEPMLVTPVASEALAWLKGLHPLGRQSADDPVIAGVWV